MEQGLGTHTYFNLSSLVSGLERMITVLTAWLRLTPSNKMHIETGIDTESKKWRQICKSQPFDITACWLAQYISGAFYLLLYRFLLSDVFFNQCRRHIFCPPIRCISFSSRVILPVCPDWPKKSLQPHYTRYHFKVYCCLLSGSQCTIYPLTPNDLSGSLFWRAYGLCAHFRLSQLQGELWPNQ